jgi:hypothetical protein
MNGRGAATFVIVPCSSCYNGHEDFSMSGRFAHMNLSDLERDPGVSRRIIYWVVIGVYWIAIGAAALSLGLLPLGAQAHGCLKGAAVGGAVGHVAGHHAAAGAAVGCVVGHHRAKLKERQAARARGGRS